MGWTTTDLIRCRMTLDQAKAEHVRQATRYSNGIDARIVMHEWHASTWYAIIRLEYPQDHERAGEIKYFLRTDMIEATPASFGYKDMIEDMGPHLDDKPSRFMAKTVFKYIPNAEGYAKDFRDWAGIPYIHEKQLELI